MNDFDDLERADDPEDEELSYWAAHFFDLFPAQSQLPNLRTVNMQQLFADIRGFINDQTQP